VVAIMLFLARCKMAWMDPWTRAEKTPLGIGRSLTFTFEPDIHAAVGAQGSLTLSMAWTLRLCWQGPGKGKEGLEGNS